MSITPDITFSPSRAAYARKAFAASGRRFSAGDLFDWRKMAVAQRRVLQMFEAGLLTHKGNEAPKEVVKAAEVIVEDKALESLDYYGAGEKTIEEELADEDIHHIATSDDLDTIEDMKELRRIADEIGAPYKVSKADQRKAIREARD